MRHNRARKVFETIARKTINNEQHIYSTDSVTNRWKDVANSHDQMTVGLPSNPKFKIEERVGQDKKGFPRIVTNRVLSQVILPLSSQVVNQHQKMSCDVATRRLCVSDKISTMC